MHLEQELLLAADLTPARLDQFHRDLTTEWIGVARSHWALLRRLPSEQVVWLVLGMALMRDRPISDVVDELDLALPVGGKREPVARSAVAQARARLGDEPREWLFMRSADAWAHESASRHRWRGLALYGVDGSTLRVPDSDENRDHFGGQSAGRAGRRPSAHPMVRLAALMALRSHLIASVFGPYAESEYTYAADLLPSVPDPSLTMVDRGSFAAAVLIPHRHFQIRAKQNNRWRVIQNLGPRCDADRRFHDGRSIGRRS